MFLAQVPFTNSGESAIFHDDHVEFKGNSLRYDQIEALLIDGRSTIIYDTELPIGDNFIGFVTFWMRDGKRHRIVVSAKSIFGIPVVFGNPRNSRELFWPLFEAVNSIVAKSVAQQYIRDIKRGQTVEMAGLLINATEVVAKKKSLKNDTMITKANFQTCQIANDGSSIAVFGKAGDLLWESSIFNQKNILLFPYILDAIFGKASNSG